MPSAEDASSSSTADQQHGRHCVGGRAGQSLKGRIVGFGNGPDPPPTDDVWDELENTLGAWYEAAAAGIDEVFDAFGLGDDEEEEAPPQRSNRPEAQLPEFPSEPPGKYIIVAKKVIVSSTLELGGAVQAELGPGAVVEVDRVDRFGTRVRAHIVNPAGWISLVDSKSMQRWAEKASAAAAASAQYAATAAAAASAGGGSQSNSGMQDLLDMEAPAPAKVEDTTDLLGAEATSTADLLAADTPAHQLQAPALAEKAAVTPQLQSPLLMPPPKAGYSVQQTPSSPSENAAGPAAPMSFPPVAENWASFDDSNPVLTLNMGNSAAVGSTAQPMSTPGSAQVLNLSFGSSASPVAQSAANPSSASTVAFASAAHSVASSFDVKLGNPSATAPVPAAQPVTNAKPALALDLNLGGNATATPSAAPQAAQVLGLDSSASKSSAATAAPQASPVAEAAQALGLGSGGSKSTSVTATPAAQTETKPAMNVPRGLSVFDPLSDASVEFDKMFT